MACVPEPPQIVPGSGESTSTMDLKFLAESSKLSHGTSQIWHDIIMLETDILWTTQKAVNPTPEMINWGHFHWSQKSGNIRGSSLNLLGRRGDIGIHLLGVSCSVALKYILCLTLAIHCVNGGSWTETSPPWWNPEHIPSWVHQCAECHLEMAECI